MKKLHLICNAHIDPIWQWTWDEGISSALATFKSAVNLAHEFDYIFCHGESLLYEAVEKNEPRLFKQIQELVNIGKWNITSGWYIQPDCVMPSGESLVRQIKVGNKYFKEKFGIEQPKIATSYDAFGHNIGLVQILRKCGYEGYMICRPKHFQFNYPGKFFNWVGTNGSKIVTTYTGAYNTELGNAIRKIENEFESAEDVDYVLWGVGNHGGGPSRKDLKEISELKLDGGEIIHSTPENLFNDNIKISGDITRSLTPCMPGCYTSMAKVKQSHRETENLLYATEKMLAVAKLNGFNYDETLFNEAQKKFLLAEFHDILPGTVVKDGENEGLELFSFAKKILKDYRTNAFLYFVMNEKKAGDGEYPIFAFNYMPYDINTMIEAEFSLSDQNWSEEFVFDPQIFDEFGNELASQQIKEESTINLDWRKKIVFAGKLKPLSITRFTIKTRKIEISKKVKKENLEIDETLKNYNSVLKSKVQLEMYEDSADPWAMSEEELHCLGNNPTTFRQMTIEEASEFCGVKTIAPIHVIEDGEIYTSIEECLTEKDTNAIIEYKIYKGQPFVDLKVTVEFANKNKLIRLKIPKVYGKTLGDGVYAIEEKTDGEIVFQKWVGKEKDGKVFAVINDCVYGGKFDDENLYITLLRGAGYCFHPTGRELYPQDRYLPRIDCGRYTFNFRLFVGEISDICREAELFNQKPYVINVFPTGELNKVYKNVEIDDNVITTTCKTVENGGLLIRLFNPESVDKTTNICIDGKNKEIKIHGGEIVSVIYNDNQFIVFYDEIIF